MKERKELEREARELENEMKRREMEQQCKMAELRERQQLQEMEARLEKTRLEEDTSSESDGVTSKIFESPQCIVHNTRYFIFYSDGRCWFSTKLYE